MENNAGQSAVLDAATGQHKFSVSAMSFPTMASLAASATPPSSPPLCVSSDSTVVDYLSTAPECDSYSRRRAATETKLHAAGFAHSKKLKTYTNVLRVGDALLSVSVEIMGDSRFVASF